MGSGASKSNPNSATNSPDRDRAISQQTTVKLSVPDKPKQRYKLSRDETELQNKQNRAIERQLIDETLQDKTTVKILLLGGAETGKTTIFKQMRILHLNGFQSHDLVRYKHQIHSNIVSVMQALIEASQKFRIVHELYVQRQVKTFMAFLADMSGWDESEQNDEACLLNPEIGEVMHRIWLANTTQICYKRRWEFTLLESAKYFLDNLRRICAHDYMPTHKDILLCRFRTTGINQISFPYRGLLFQMVDVGGQKTERRKWIHCFDNVSLVLFIVSLADFDLYDPDDTDLNRLHNNLTIFNSVVRSHHFKNASVCLFLNKADIFQEKLEIGGSLRTCFSDYKGANSFDDSVQFLISRFDECIIRPSKLFFPFVSTATDTQRVQKVFASAVSHVIQNNMKLLGIQP